MSAPRRVLTLLAAFSAVGTSAQNLTLETAVSEALDASPKIQKARSQREEADWKVTEAWSGFLPSVAANANYLLAKDYMLTDVTLAGAPAPMTIPNIVPTSSLTLTSQLSVFDGFASTNRLRAARSFGTAADSDYDWTRFQVEREVTSLFYKALGAVALRDVAEQNLKTLEDHLRDARNFKQQGISTNFDVLRVEVQVSSAKSDLLDATDNVEISRNRLAEALGKDAEARQPTGQLPAPDASWINDLKNFDSGQRADLHSLRDKTAALAYADSAANRYWVPRFSLFGQYITYNNRNDGLTDWNKYRDSYQLGVAMSWNIFDGMSSIAKSRQAAEQRFQAEKSLHMSELHAKQDFEMWRRKFLYQCAVYAARNSDVQKAAESVRLAKVGRTAGVRTNAELLDAEVDLNRARAGLVNAQIGAAEAILNLELTTGQRIAGFKQR